MTVVQFHLMMFAIVTSVGVGCNRTPAVTAQTAQQSDLESSAVAVPIVESTFDDIKFDMEKTDEFQRSMLTPKVEQLFDRRIRIRGYMFPTLKKRGLKQFVLVRDNLECCFGPGAALFDCIAVQMNEGQTAEYSIRPVTVEGTFRLDEVIAPDGQHLAIYRLDGESVE